MNNENPTPAVTDAKGATVKSIDREFLLTQKKMLVQQKETADKTVREYAELGQMTTGALQLVEHLIGKLGEAEGDEQGETPQAKEG